MQHNYTRDELVQIVIELKSEVAELRDVLSYEGSAYAARTGLLKVVAPSNHAGAYVSCTLGHVGRRMGMTLVQAPDSTCEWEISEWSDDLNAHRLEHIIKKLRSVNEDKYVRYLDGRGLMLNAGVPTDFYHYSWVLVAVVPPSAGRGEGFVIASVGHGGYARVPLAIEDDGAGTRILSNSDSFRSGDSPAAILTFETS